MLREVAEEQKRVVLLVLEMSLYRIDVIWPYEVTWQCANRLNKFASKIDTTFRTLGDPAAIAEDIATAASATATFAEGQPPKKRLRIRRRMAEAATGTASSATVADIVSLVGPEPPPAPPTPAASRLGASGTSGDFIAASADV